MEHLGLIVITIVLYLLAAGSFSARLLTTENSDASLLRPAAMTMGALAALMHAVLLYGQVLGGPQLDLGFFNAGSLMAWLMVLLVLLSAVRKPVENLAVLILPIGAVALFLAAVLGTPGATRSPTTAGSETHILASVLAYSVLSVAALQALLVAFQDHQLRNRHPTGLVRLMPPLRIMEDMLFQMLWVGFALLSLSLLTGFVFLENIFAQHLVHKTILSVVAWLVFATLLFGRWRFGWRGRIAIRWTLGGFIALMLAYFGTKLVLELILQR
ncbi:MAG: cytochrome c biogenesis protein CcsA [Ectothiorhodospiraceae bacterium]|nr:cytochrome c biogenesis protein CcsA [Ectothiorhodospiraceae bacterium]MCH8503759.1 cytochrome c biogenesis protein CcsA [Ectothiorhodospiraceae bacterium]